MTHERKDLSDFVTEETKQDLSDLEQLQLQRELASKAADIHLEYAAINLLVGLLIGILPLTVYTLMGRIDFWNFMFIGVISVGIACVFMFYAWARWKLNQKYEQKVVQCDALIDAKLGNKR